MDSVAVGFFFAVWAVSCLAVSTWRWHMIALSVLLCALWAYSKVIAHFWGWDVARTCYPIGDVVSVGVVMLVWWKRPNPWVLGMAMAIVTKLLLHVVYLTDTHPSKTDMYNQALALNILFAVEILCVGLSGGEIVGAGLSSWLSPPWRWHGRPSFASGRHSEKARHR